MTECLQKSENGFHQGFEFFFKQQQGERHRQAHREEARPDGDRKTRDEHVHLRYRPTKDCQDGIDDQESREDGSRELEGDPQHVLRQVNDILSDAVG